MTIAPGFKSVRQRDRWNHCLAPKFAENLFHSFFVVVRFQKLQDVKTVTTARLPLTFDLANLSGIVKALSRRYLQRPSSRVRLQINGSNEALMKQAPGFAANRFCVCSGSFVSPARDEATGDSVLPVGASAERVEASKSQVNLAIVKHHPFQHELAERIPDDEQRGRVQHEGVRHCVAPFGVRGDEVADRGLFRFSWSPDDHILGIGLLAFKRAFQ